MRQKLGNLFFKYFGARLRPAAGRWAACFWQLPFGGEQILEQREKVDDRLPDAV
jgi:hypothetical protein